MMSTARRGHAAWSQTGVVRHRGSSARCSSSITGATKFLVGVVGRAASAGSATASATGSKCTSGYAASGDAAVSYDTVLNTAATGIDMKPLL